MAGTRSISRRARPALTAALALALLPAAAQAHIPRGEPGAPGIGDPYFPLAGNGGYDVARYDLDVAIDPVAKTLVGHAVVSARATQTLSRFDLDLVGLTVRSVRVDGRAAAWTRDGGELVVTPRHVLPRGDRFSVDVRYDGAPTTVDSGAGAGGVLPTSDGLMIIGEPDVAATWFPVNDHPADKARYAIDVTVPAGYQAVSNGRLVARTAHGGRTTYRWREDAPMASYLATATVGRFQTTSYRADGLHVYDAIDPTLFAPFATPSTGSQFLVSGHANASYKRLVRTITVPVGGATVSFDATRDTEREWDFFFVEAHQVGSDAWTTLPDANGHTSDDTGFSCPFGGWQAIHPFLAHYQTDNADGSCSAVGTTGTWSAATGSDDARERWSIDLSAYAGQQVEVALAYASDDVVQQRGVYIDDIDVSTGDGTTSFEDDGDTLDGWTVAGPPAGSPGNDDDWHVGTVADVPEPRGFQVQRSFAREPEIVHFLASKFGPYPFGDVGGIVDHLSNVGFALENQTRPIYAEEFFDDPIGADSVVVHELAHQWYGDAVSVERWRDIWLNEGFATYAEWLWAEHEGLGTPQEQFDGLLGIPADNGFWQLVIGDPGVADLFAGPVYARGAMTLQALRLAVGDDAFFRIMRRWVAEHGGGNGTTAQFIALAERISHRQLDDLFQTWLYTAGKPVVGAVASARRAAAATTTPPHVLGVDALKAVLRGAPAGARR